MKKFIATYVEPMVEGVQQVELEAPDEATARHHFVRQFRVPPYYCGLLSMEEISVPDLNTERQLHQLEAGLAALTERIEKLEAASQSPSGGGTLWSDSSEGRDPVGESYHKDIETVEEQPTQRIGFSVIGSTSEEHRQFKSRLQGEGPFRASPHAKDIIVTSGGRQIIALYSADDREFVLKILNALYGIYDKT